ncbi:MAG: WYL domain-containing protein [Akkermansiaceae bacterium]|nr:WYL domain-containing protein [Armatimonadota bacterium]
MDDFYRVPLSTGEATAAIAALRVVCALLQREGIVSDIAPEILESAAARIEAEIPEFLGPSAEKLRTLLAETLVHANFPESGSDESNELSMPPFGIGRTRRILEQARRSSGIVEIEYYVASRNQWSTRSVEIGDVYESENGWYLEGECQLRRDHRMFRLENIRSARVVLGKVSAEDELPDPFDDEGNA